MNIRISNLIDSTTEDDLIVLMQKYGSPSEMRIVTDRYTAKDLIIVYLKLEDEVKAAKAIAELHGKDIGGEVIKVVESINV